MRGAARPAVARTECIELRAEPEREQRIRYAAKSAGQSLTDFMLDAASERAEQDITSARVTVVPADVFDALWDARDEPPSSPRSSATGTTCHASMAASDGRTGGCGGSPGTPPPTGPRAPSSGTPATAWSSPTTLAAPEVAKADLRLDRGLQGQGAGVHLLAEVFGFAARSTGTDCFRR
jgi:uncharacterized protein (DUF1778 family)